MREQTLFLIAAVLGMAGVFGCRGQTSPPKAAADASGRAGPDIVIVSVDTLRADHMSVYGYFRRTTPHIDRLADRARVYEQAFTVMGHTLPAHISLMTSVHPATHNVLANTDVYGGAFPTLAQMLSEHGYATGGFVSGVPLAAQSRFNLGFQTYDDTGRDGKRLIPKRPGDETVAHALRWVRGLSPDKSMFLFVHLFETHNPYWTPDDLTPPFQVDAELDARLEAMGVGDVDIGETTPVDILLDERPLKTLAAAINAYDNQVYLADHLFHRLLRELEAAGRLRDALVVLTSDHGEGLGEHGLYSHGMHLYEEQIHIPLIVMRYGASWPAERVRRVVSILDIMPTVLDEVGIAAPEHLMGRSLSAAGGGEPRWLLMQRREFDQTNRKRRGAQFAPADPLRAVRGDERYKYLLTGDLHSPIAEELYDLDTDPHEWRNLFAEQPQIARRLRTILTLRVEEYEAKAVETGGRQSDAETEAAMKALGYAP